MTQDRRKDNQPRPQVEWTDEKLIAAALAHLEAERAGACLVHAKDDVWVGVGSKGALRGLLSDDTASQSQAVPSELASLKIAYYVKEDEDGPEFNTVDEFSWARTGGEALVKLSDVARLFSHSAATGKTRKTTISPEMKAALDKAAETGALAAETPDGIAFINRGHDYGDNAHLECTACGGSGHIEDQRAIAQQAEAAPVANVWPAVRKLISESMFDFARLEGQPESEIQAWVDERVPAGRAAPVSSDIPKKALEAANSLLCDMIGKREWDVPCAAKHIMAYAAPVASAEPIYVPGTWFEAQTLDEMQAFYLSRLPAIREAAKEHGYAIGLHGSERRDFDLMAMQWREGASDKDTLARAIADAACGIRREGAYDWEQKPSGRVATSIPVCWTACDNPDFDKPSVGHIDLSIIESVAQAAPAPADEARNAALEEAASECGKVAASDIGEEGTRAACDCLSAIRTLKSRASPAPEAAAPVATYELASALNSLRWMLNKSDECDKPNMRATTLLDKHYSKAGRTIRQDLEYLWRYFDPNSPEMIAALFSSDDKLAAPVASQPAQSEQQQHLERAADILEQYAKYCYEVKLEDIEQHPYIPSIEEAAESLRAMILGGIWGRASQPAGGEEASDKKLLSEKTEQEKDELYDKAAMVVVSMRRASVSLVQRHLMIGYNRASRLIEAMERAGVVSEPDSSGHRTVIATPDTQQEAGK